MDSGSARRYLGRMPTRAATAGDVSALHALIEGAYRGESARGGWTHEADLLEGPRTDPTQLAAFLADPAATILIAEDARGLAGCVLVVDRGGCGYLGLLSVRPDAQTAGLGRALIAAAEDYARDVLGQVRIEMTVIRQRPELIAYYQRRGYALTGRTEPFPYAHQGFNAAIRDDLVLEVLAKAL